MGLHSRKWFGCSYHGRHSSIVRVGGTRTRWGSIGRPEIPRDGGTLRTLYSRQLLMLLWTVSRRRMQEVLFTWLLAMLNWTQCSICTGQGRKDSQMQQPCRIPVNVTHLLCGSATGPATLSE